MSSQINPSPPGVIAPTQARGTQTQAKLVAATLRLLDDQYFENLSVAEITREAGVATGTFYRRFESKEAMLPLLYDVYDRIYADWAQSVRSDRRFESPKLRERMQALVSGTLDLYSLNRGLIRALHLNSRLNVDLQTVGSTTQRAEQYRSIELLIGDAISSPDDRRRLAKQITLLMISTINETILYPDCTPSSVTDLSTADVEKMLADAASALVEASAFFA